MNFGILDCSLRDGGYYTNWDFPDQLVDKYTAVLSEYPINFVEVGYRSPIKEGYAGQYFYLPAPTIRKIRAGLRADQMITIMLNTKDCSADDMRPLLSDLTGEVDTIRLAVDPAQLDHALQLAEAIKSLGFKVAVNLMYLSEQNIDSPAFETLAESGQLIDIVNLVDSYGSCYPAQVLSFFSQLKQSLPQTLGFHGHDNIGLAFANSLAALEGGAHLIDSTLLGMGRGAGNLRTELLLAYQSRVNDAPVDLTLIGDLLDDFQLLKDKYGWGTALPYIISGLYGLPQKEVMELLSIRRFTTRSIVETVQASTRNNAGQLSTPPNAKALEDAAGDLGIDGVTNCIIVGGGESARLHAEVITRIAEQDHAVIIHSSLKNIHSYVTTEAPQLLCLPGDEAWKVRGALGPSLFAQFRACIISSQWHGSSISADQIPPLFTVDPFVACTEDPKAARGSYDSPVAIALSATRFFHTPTVYLAGVDGYDGTSEIDKFLAVETQRVLDLYQATFPDNPLHSLTPSLYDVPQTSAYGLLSKLR